MATDCCVLVFPDTSVWDQFIYFRFEFDYIFLNFPHIEHNMLIVEKVKNHKWAKKYEKLPMYHRENHC